MITIKKLKLAYPGKTLFYDANLILNKGMRIGLVGKNGVGKTSLFKLILGKIEQDDGELTIIKGADIGYVEQEIEDLDINLVEYVVSSHPIYKNEQYDLPEYYKLRPAAEKMLIDLGFSQDELNYSIGQLSGGWQMRASLARALFFPSDLLLLDEPTNHLDVETVIWLEDWIRQYKGLIIIISHDREFLDATTTDTIEICNKKLNLYSGNYSTFQEVKYLKIQEQQSSNKKKLSQIEHLQKFVDRFRASATKAKQAQSKIKAIEKLKISQSLSDDLYEDSSIHVEFLQPANSIYNILSLRNGRVGYLNHAGNTKCIDQSSDSNSKSNSNNCILIDKIKFELHEKDRIGLLGRNGVGKSSFIKSLIHNHDIINNRNRINNTYNSDINNSNQILAKGDDMALDQDQMNPLLSGELIIDKKVQIGYFAQHTVDQLNPNDTPISFLQQNHVNKTESNLRTYLGSFGFVGDAAFQKIKVFSGGEKARLVIADIILKQPNLLILDEPTNHLDMQMREELAKGIADFNGAVIIVSHDKFLLNSIVENFYLIKDKQLKKFTGSLDDYHELLMSS